MVLQESESEVVMPTFPKYRGELPKCLNPLNLRHYFLLAYWVYFRPSALNCYIHQADPNFHNLRGLEKYHRLWYLKAYRNLYLMLPVGLLLFSLLVGLSIFLYSLYTVQIHADRVNAVAVTPDRNWAISASDDRTLKIWNLQQGIQQRTLEGHSEGIKAISLTPDGKQAISASEDGTLKVWDLKSGTKLYTLKGHTDWVKAVVVTPEGKQAISASDDKTLKVWNLETGALLHTLKGHTNWVNAVALIGDGQWAISASADGTLKVWDLQTGAQLYTLKDHTDWVNAVVVTADGQRAISASDDDTLKIWDLQTGTALRTLSGHTKWVTALSITPDGKRIISASADGTLKLWDLQTGTELRTLKGHTDMVNAVAVTPDGKWAISGSDDLTLKVWNLQRGIQLLTFKGNTSGIKTISLTSDGKRVISGSADGMVKVWNLDTGKELPMTLAENMPLENMVLKWGIRVMFGLVAIGALFGAAVVLSATLLASGVAGMAIGGLVFSLLFAVIFAVAIGFIFDVTDSIAIGNHSVFAWAMWISFGIAITLVFNVAGGLVSRTAFGVVGTMVPILVFSVGVSAVVGLLESLEQKNNAIAHILLSRFGDNVADLVWLGLMVTLPISIGALRILFYPFQFALSLRSMFRSTHHPVEWDELVVLPLPGTRQLVTQCLQLNETAGLMLVSELARNPFQRWVAQQALQIYLHSRTVSVHLLYKLLTHPELNTYIFPPVSKQDWERFPPTGHLLMGELGGIWVNCSPDWVDRFSERLIWYLTYLRRDRRNTPLTRFARMLYQLLDEKTVNAEQFDLAGYRKIYTRLTSYPNGVEIEQSFDAMASFLSYKELEALPKAVDAVAEFLLEETVIRPTVLKTLNRLRDIASIIATYQVATSLVSQQSALLRATYALKTLDEYVATEVVPPERTILRRIIRQWSKLIIEKGGEVGRIEAL